MATRPKLRRRRRTTTTLVATAVVGVIGTAASVAPGLLDSDGGRRLEARDRVDLGRGVANGDGHQSSPIS